MLSKYFRVRISRIQEIFADFDKIKFHCNYYTVLYGFSSIVDEGITTGVREIDRCRAPLYYSDNKWGLNRTKGPLS